MIFYRNCSTYSMKQKFDIADFKITDEIGILKLNNPPQNYLIEPAFADLEKLQRCLNDDIKGLIITGTGRHFSAGADMSHLKEMAANGGALEKKMTAGNRLLNFIYNLDIPTIAAIKGVCFVGGLEIALSCQIRFCNSKALFAFPEVNHGLIPGLGGIVRASHLIGNAALLQMALGGDVMDAGKALEIKLVDAIIETEEVENYAIKMMKKMVEDRSPEVIHAIMQAIRNSEKMTMEEAIAEETKLFCKLALSGKAFN